MRLSNPFRLTLSVSIILHLGMMMAALVTLSGNTALTAISDTQGRSFRVMLSSATEQVELTAMSGEPVALESSVLPQQELTSDAQPPAKPANPDTTKPHAITALKPGIEARHVLSSVAEADTGADPEQAPEAIAELAMNALPEAEPLTRLDPASSSIIDPLEQTESQANTLHNEQYVETLTSKENELLERYMQQVQMVLEAQKFYPNRLRKMRKEGWVELTFTLDRSGSIHGKRVARFDGHASFQQAALAALENVGQFPDFPEEIDRTVWAFNIKLQYTLN